MRAAVASDACGGLVVASLDCLAVEAAIVRSLLVRVAGFAADFQRRSFVRGTLDVGVAVHAGEHAAVDGIFERLRIDVQADGFAIDLVSQRGVAMTSETFFRSGFRRLLTGGLFAGGVGRCGRKKQGESTSGRKNSPYSSRGHALPRQFFRIERSPCGGGMAAALSS